MKQFFPPGVRRAFTRTLRAWGYQLVNLERMYEFDGLHTVHHARFRDNPRFESAWNRAVQASGGVDPRSAWRIHIGLWAASIALQVPGDFVECGVNTGFLSTAILQYFDWANLHRRFFLVDTFAGPVL